MMPGTHNTDIQKLTARIAYPILKKKLFDQAEGEAPAWKEPETNGRAVRTAFGEAPSSGGHDIPGNRADLVYQDRAWRFPGCFGFIFHYGIWGINYALSTFGVYMLFLAVQLLLKGKARRPGELLQIPFSLVFGLLLDWFSLVQIRFYTLWQNLLLLFAAMAFTAVGMSMMVDMRLVLSPADGLADTIGNVQAEASALEKILWICPAWLLPVPSVIFSAAG